MHANHAKMQLNGLSRLIKPLKNSNPATFGANWLIRNRINGFPKLDNLQRLYGLTGGDINRDVCMGFLPYLKTRSLHLLLFISAKRTFICAKRCINNLYCTFLNTASNIIGAKRLSIAIFKYARAFNSINRQSTKRRDNHLGGTLFHVRAIKIQ